MVSYSMQPYYRQASLTVDTAQAQQKYFEEDDSSILDEGILDRSGIDSGLEMSPQMIDSRRDSFAVGSSLFSPKHEDWTSVEMQSIPSNNPFLDPHSNNPFLRLDQHQHQQPQPFAQQPTSWPMTATSSSASHAPMTGFDGLPTDFDASTPMFHRPSIQSQSSFAGQGAHVNMFSSMNGQSIPSSPQKDAWVGQNQSMPKKMRPSSPLIRSHNELRRGDGVRKKNARFDIPAERNLSNIDHLIAQSTDEQEIKELKQQKRLLRNRQAALDSRQRKKQHTERLEDEKKHYTSLLSEMEDKVAEMDMQMAQLMRENQGYQEYVQKLNLEKEEMIREHTIETGELRKKIGVLTSHVQQLEGNAMPSSSAISVSQTTGFPGPFGDMDGLTMEGGWDNMGFMPDFSLDQVAEVKQELQMVPASKKNEVSLPSADAEKPAAQGGLLFMLFLVGAFVLSSRQTPSIPRVSDDVRAASKTLLDNVLKDAGVPQSTSAMAPQPSGPANWGHAPAAPMMTGLDSVAPSMLGDLSDSLTRPTQQQTNEQLFSLTAAQYNGVNSQDFLQTPPPERAASQGRRNLADALASMRNNNKAEVYTRSLLWDQIPSDVVRTFAKMVAECSTQNGAEQACGNEAGR